MTDPLHDQMKRIEGLLAKKTATLPIEEASSLDTLKRIALDRSASLEPRVSAIASLGDRLRAEPELGDLILRLLDPREEPAAIVVAALGVAPPFDVRVIERIRLLLGSPDRAIQFEAARTLSRRKDRETLPLMLSWARSGPDLERRRVGLAAVAFLLIPEEHLATIEEIIEREPDDQAEEILAEALAVADRRVAFWRKATGQEEP